MRHLMVFLLSCLAATAAAGAQECICRIEDASVTVKNLPEVQKVHVVDTTVPVKETDITRTYTYSAQFSTGEKRAFGPILLDGRHRIQLQLSQLFPKAGTPSAVTVRWYVRYHADDAFFDPCAHEANGPLCTAGFPALGGKLRPLKPTTLAALVDGFSVMDESPVTVSVLDVVGTEGLLVLENTAAGPREIRANLILDR